MAKKIEKKEVMLEAVRANANRAKAAAATAAEKKTAASVGGAKKAAQWLKNKAKKVADWFRKTNKMVFFNIVLLGLLVAMLTVMLVQVKTEKRVASNTASVAIASRPTVVVSRGEYIAPNPKPMVKTIVTRQIIRTIHVPVYDGTLLLDGRKHATRMPAGSVITGNLILQNMARYTLPCGVRVNGDLFLRNVNMLKFCGRFAVKGNIYVSSNSSFGPIPKNAMLGGQVIF